MDPNSFFRPDGELPADRFPEVDEVAYVERWIERGKTETGEWLTSEDYYDGRRADDPHGGYDDPFSSGNYPPHQPFESSEHTTVRERAVVAWVYWHAWDHIFERLTGEPSNVSIGSEYSASYTQSQIESYRKRRDRWKEHWRDLVTGDASLKESDEIRSVTTQTEVTP
jgi:hypothetical protein